MNSTHASTVFPPQWDLPHFWLRGVVYTGAPFPLPPLVATSASQTLQLTQRDWRRRSAQVAVLMGTHRVELAPRVCMVLVQAVLEYSVSEAARGRTGSVEQSGCEGEGRGAVQKVHLAPMQAALISSTTLAELSKHTQMHVSPICLGAALAHAGAPTGWHAQLLPAGSSPGDSLSQSRLPGEAAAELSPCPAQGSFPGARGCLRAPQHLFERKTREEAHGSPPGHKGGPA